MKQFKLVLPHLPNSTFKFAIDPACIDTAMDNGNVYDLTTNTGAVHRVIKEQSLDSLMELITEAKKQRYGIHRL